MPHTTPSPFKSILRLVFTTLLAAFVITTILNHHSQVLAQRVEASGNLTVTFNNAPLSGPIFTVTNFLPGDCTSQTVTVTNNGTEPAPIAVRSLNESDPHLLSTQLHLTISENNQPLYGGPSDPKILSDFFTDSLSENGITLSDISPSASTDYQFTVCFEPSASNDYQNTFVTFDLIFGRLVEDAIDLPAECSHLQGTINKVITGTESNDTLRGTTANELILGLGGNDRIYGATGNDCLIGGDGNDRLYGSTGQDVLVGGDGNDYLDGQTNSDIIWGGDGDDRLKGGTNDDYLYAGSGDDDVNGGPGNDHLEGNTGNDKLSGSTGDDYIYGQEGNDQLNGQSGNDHLYGGSGDDTLKAGTGDDYLDGEADTDYLDGSLGTDTCRNGESLHHCEL